jgi:RNA polymerase sigma factor (sigma-70 family)
MSTSDAVVVNLFRSHNRELSNFLRRRVGQQEAEDIAQDAYLRLLRDGNSAELEYPRSYLFRVASNLAIDMTRKAKVRMARHVEDVDFDSLGTDANGGSGNHAMEMICLQRCLANLPPMCRNVFLLNRIYGLTYPEIAVRLEISLRTVNRNMIRASSYVDKHLKS